ncbi:hypothetical protein BDR03DRAFT_985073 [Suillus americanus]|nr:hypothetical protein BDR03DRAFT_985073 [Suillus americanus]
MSQETQCCYADESSSDERTTSMHSVVQGLISNPIQRRAVVEPRLGPEKVKSAQLKNQALKERLHAVEEQNKVLSANKRHCKQDNTVSKDILALEAELKICAKQYGLTINMFPPPAALLKARAGDRNSGGIFSKVLCAGCASELNKLRSAAGQIFDLPQHYFAISHTCDMEPEIRQLLGITGKAGESYPLLPPMLFPGNLIDRTRKTLFGNWQPIAKTLSCCLKGRTSLSNQGKRQGSALPNAVKWGVTVVTPGAVAWAIVTNIFILSPDQEFPQEGKGKTSRINYGTVIAFFKELLICDWEKPRLKGIIKSINNFVFEC